MRTRWVLVGRVILAFVFAGIAAYCAYAFATMPYELVTVTTTSTAAKPDGSGLFIFGIVCLFVAVIAAFSGDWWE